MFLSKTTVGKARKYKNRDNVCKKISQNIKKVHEIDIGNPKNEDASTTITISWRRQNMKKPFVRIGSGSDTSNNPIRTPNRTKKIDNTIKLFNRYYLTKKNENNKRRVFWAKQIDNATPESHREKQITLGKENTLPRFNTFQNSQHQSPTKTYRKS